MLVEKEKPSEVSSSTAAFITESGSLFPDCNKDETLALDSKTCTLDSEFHDCLIPLIGSVMLALLVHQDFRAAQLKIGSHIDHDSFHRLVDSPSPTARSLQASLGLPPRLGVHLVQDPSIR